MGAYTLRMNVPRRFLSGVLRWRRGRRCAGSPRRQAMAKELEGEPRWIVVTAFAAHHVRRSHELPSPDFGFPAAGGLSARTLLLSDRGYRAEPFLCR
jgi:hypothetical protein